MTMEQQHSAGVITYKTIDDQVEYLLLHYQSGHWDFPKGKLEAGETKQQAACRELQEETGLTAQLDEEFEKSFSYIFHDYHHQKKLIQKTVYFFIGKAVDGPVHLSDEHIDFLWLPYNQAIEQLTYDNAKILLKKAHKHLLAHKESL